MGRLPVIMGYLGTLPFVLLMLMSFFAKTEKHEQVATVLQLLFATVILSFLGGVHWGQAVPTGNIRQLTFSMIPTICCLFLLGWAFMIGSAFPLLALAGLFFAVYVGDHRFMPPAHTPEKYFNFRKRLTIIVCTTLFISFLGNIF